MSALEERRQAALTAGFDEMAIREAYWDNIGTAANHGIEAAIETATRVRLTPEILAATGLPAFAARAVLEAGFRAAGFEVEQ